MEAIHKEVQRVLEKAPGTGTFKAPKKPSTSRSAKVATSADESVLDALDHLLESLEEAKRSTLPAQILTAQLQQKVTKCSKTINDKHKEYYNALSKLGKALDKKFVIPIDGVADANLFQNEDAQRALNRVIRDHLERSGEWEVARMFEQEAKMNKMDSFLPSGTFQMLHNITTEIKRGELSQAIAWATQESDFLAARRSPLEFNLHRSRFIRIALGMERWSPSSGGYETEGDELHEIPSTYAALRYGQQYLVSRKGARLEEIQKLFTFLLFLHDVREALPRELLLARIPEPYHIFLDEDEMHGHSLAPLFQREFTARQGVAREAPLKVAVEVGASGALNIIIKVRTLMKEKGNEWSQADELPVEIPLPAHLRFHSIFACPVSKEQGTEENPPMMMQCGHVVCQESLTRLGKGTGRVKCPYCPIESTVSQADRVYF
ncbi:uncharacterized protein FA14DRAFT_121738 [Meira miltonrushii]|uniref:GID complex catalytic subunit 2 n=1 Tax=Meira miltonrushii TaxID=1280837 RepID=A0A316VCW8_9BASI|nr:uncharacterized protein FA14DRAFT_121738 [Meira miltonrushii]PWN35330.1 hypothetical protein FA14DRAFT_121738 [Meira miltonrushii]